MELQPEEARQGHLVHPYRIHAQDTWGLLGTLRAAKGCNNLNEKPKWR